MKKGIDVSYANGSIDWVAAKKDIDFAIVRSSFGDDLPSQIDSFFYQNANGCVKNNIPFGTYHFAYFVDEKTAKNEADFAIRLANEYKDKVKFIALDIEEDSERYAHNRVGASPDWTACALTFMNRIKVAGYTPVLYSNQSWLQNKLDYSRLKDFKLWYAAPGAASPKYSCALWQYTWEVRISGIRGDVDGNICYDDSLFSGTKSTSVGASTGNNSDKKTTPSMEVDYDVVVTANDGVDVTYQAHTISGKWLESVKNTDDFAGIENRKIDGIKASPEKGYIMYRAHLLNGNWLPWVCNTDDYAGVYGKEIDGIQAAYFGENGYDVEYRVSTTGSMEYLDWIKNYGSDEDGYAGVFGKPIDKVQFRIVKK